ncbi:MAG: transcriptional regulator [Promethearchaeota archaeon]
MFFDRTKSHKELCVTKFKDLTWGNLSSHLTKLESVGYVHVTKEFIEKKSRTTVKLTQLGRDRLQLYRNHMKALLE